MQYLVLLKLRGKLDRDAAEHLKNHVRDEKGYKTIGFYWLIGPYDAAWLLETDQVDNLAKKLSELQDTFETTTMVALPLSVLAP